jgi:hypothetical protein
MEFFGFVAVSFFAFIWKLQGLETGHFSSRSHL